MKKCFLLLAIVLFSIHASAQVAKTSELFIRLAKQDSVFFERSFNACDLDYLAKAIHKDLIFFHDQGGVQNRADFLENVKRNICGNPAQKPIRKLQANSLEVFPLYKDGILYGAVQNGVHDFFIREAGKPDRPTSQARFTHVWLLENEAWLLKEVLSFDHNAPAKAAAQDIFEKEITALLLQEKVPALGLGIIEAGTLQQIKLFGNSNANTAIAYNAIFKVASLTKPVTALVALKLISAGKLGLDEPLYKYWADPDLKNDARIKKLTPKIILSHQTGFANWRYLNENKKLVFEFEPGTKFQYSGEGFEYLRKAMEVKFGKKLEQLADSLIFKAAKMKDTHFWWDASMNEKRYVKNYDKD
ncbi:MAG: serine hydrolase, partial [Flavihumibacter sp.]|nr:serine hydrolase [Flavihumibacter sp.]